MNSREKRQQQMALYEQLDSLNQHTIPSLSRSKDVHEKVDRLLIDKLIESKANVTWKPKKHKSFKPLKSVSAKKILLPLISLALIFAVITSMLPIFYGEGDFDISVSIGPNNVTEGDLVFVNATIPVRYNITDVWADIASIDTINLTLIANTTSDQFWQGTWILHNLSAGDHIVNISAVDFLNTSYYMLHRWNIASNVSENETITIDSESITNETITSIESGNISAEQLHQLLTSGQNILLIDIRDSNIYATGHIPGAISIPLVDLGCNSCLQKMLAEHLNGSIMVYGEDDIDSNMAYIMLQEHNYSLVYTLKGGITSWINAGFAITKPPDEESVESQIDQSLKAGKPVFLFFYMNGCNYCQDQESVLVELKEEYGTDINFIHVHRARNPEAIETFGVTSYPSMFFIANKDQDGYIYKDLTGFTSKEKLIHLFDQALIDNATFDDWWHGEPTSHRPLGLPLPVAAKIAHDKEAQVIIKYKDESNFTEKTSSLKLLGFVTTAEISSEGIIAGVLDRSIYEKIKFNSDIVAVYPDINFTVFLDESLPLIRYDEVFQEFGVTGSGKKICILDTGIDSSVVNYSYGYDFVNDDSIPDDAHGHGTKVAAVIKAIAPNAELIVAKVIGADGIGYESDVLEGLQWCIDQHPDIISFSIGSQATCTGFCDVDFVAELANTAVEQGIFVVAATGNDGSKNLTSPACGSNVFSVGATDDNDNIASFSNVNPTLDLFAPGVDISTVASTSSGTSMSAPHVAGAVALILEYESLNPADIKYRLRSTGVPVEYIYNENLTIDIARLDIYNALTNNKTMEPYNYSWWWQDLLRDGEDYGPFATCDANCQATCVGWGGQCKSSGGRAPPDCASARGGGCTSDPCAHTLEADDCGALEYCECSASYANSAPTVSGEDPENESTGVPLYPTFGIMVNDSDADDMNITFYSNASGSWQEFGNISLGSNNVFGYEKQGANSLSIYNIIRGTSFTSPANGAASNITAYIGYSTTGNVGIKCALYYKSNNTLLAYTEEKIKNGVYETWETFNFGSPEPSLVAGEEYYIVAWAGPDTGSGSVWLRYNSLSNFNRSMSDSETYNGFPNTISPTSVNDLVYRIYVSYNTSSTPDATYYMDNFDVDLPNQKYYWNISVNDGTITNDSDIFWFATGALSTSIDTISPYNVTSSSLTVNATASTGVDNVTLYYRYSSDNSTWTGGDITDEIGIIYEETNAQQSTTTNRILETLDSDDFIPGEDYLLVASAHVRGSDDAARVGTKLRHGSGSTNWVFTPTDEEQEGPFDITTEWVYSTFIKWTAIHGEDITLFGDITLGDTAYWTDVSLMAIPLDDLIENTGWFYDDDTTAEDNMDDSWSKSGASITITPDGSSNYLVLGTSRCEFDVNEDDDTLRMRLYDGSSELTRVERDSENTEDEAVLTLMYVLESPAAASKTYSLQFCGDGTHDKLSSQLFIIRLDAFENFIYNQTSEDSGITETVWTRKANNSVSLNYTGNVLALWGGRYQDNGGFALPSSPWNSAVKYRGGSDTSTKKQTDDYRICSWDYPADDEDADIGFAILFDVFSVSDTNSHYYWIDVSAEDDDFDFVNSRGISMAIITERLKREGWRKWTGGTNPDTSSPWSWSFGFPNGTGYYEFYSIGKKSGWADEEAPSSADAICYRDNTTPSSSVKTISPYWNNTGSVELSVYAYDGESGVKNVTLWYRYSTDNSSWGGWVENTTETDYDWNWTFTFPNGTGYYEFYSIAIDNASNTEDPPGIADMFLMASSGVTMSTGGRQIVRTSDGTIHVIYYNSTDTKVMYARSYNDGMTWNIEVLEDNPYSMVGVAADDDDNLHFCIGDYRNIADANAHRLWYKNGTVNKAGDPWTWSWGSTIEVADARDYGTSGDTWDRVRYPHILIDANDYLHIVWTKYDDPILIHSYSINGGSSWNTQASSDYGSGSYDISVDVDPATQDIWTVMRQWSGTGGNGFYQRIQYNGGTSWTIVGRVSWGTNYRHSPAAVISGDSYLYFKWYDNNVGATYVRYSPLPTISWSSDYTVTTDGYYDGHISRGHNNTEVYIIFKTDANNANYDIAYRKFWRNNNSFSGVTYITDNNDGNAEPNSVMGPFGSKIDFIWREGTSSPYDLYYGRITEGRDAICGFDNQPPSSSVNPISPYVNTTGSVELTATASDSLTGVKNVTLWYRYSTDNNSWGGWVENTTETDYDWNWTFTFPNGTGYYEFYSRAYDNASNYEGAPGSADARCHYTVPINTSVDTITPYEQTTSPLTINATSTDATPDNITLWYRHSIDNSSWDSNWYNSSFGYRRLVTIDHTKVDETLINFPLLVYTTGLNTGNIQSDGDDILFVLYSDNTTKLNHEIERYSSGTLWAWVNVTSLSSSADTKIWMYYGNSTCSSQENVAGTWDSNYKAVWHKHDNTTSSIADSTSNANDGDKKAANEPIETDGQICKAQDYDGDEYIGCGQDASLNVIGDITVSIWLNTSTELGGHLVHKYRLTPPYNGYGLMLSHPNVRFFDGTSWRADTTTVDDGSWHHIAFVGSGATGQFYVDGDAADTTGFAGIPDNSGYSLTLGSHYNVDSGFLTGVMDEVRVSNVARNNSWINTSFHTGNRTAGFLTWGNEEREGWMAWNNASQNPDTESPWSWDFGFPDGGGYYEFYSIGKKSGSVDETPPASTDAMCHYLENTSINVTPSEWNQGSVNIGDTNETTGFYFNLTNEGNVALDITINATHANTTTGAKWNLTSPPGHDNYSLWYKKNGDSGWTNITTSFASFVTDLAIDSWQTFDLKLLMATTSSTVDPMSLTVTFKSVAS